ncbi:MAG: DUF2953 domain-containing protein [Bacillota bacterium]|jgi:hypothetical protein
MMVIWVLVILLLSLLIILLLPVSVQTTATLGDGLQCTGQIRWAAGLVKARFQLGGETTTTTVQLGLWDRPWQPRKRTKKRKRTLSQLSQLQPFLTTAVWQAVSRFLRQLLAALRLRWRVWGVFGTGDPAWTGYLTAALAVSGLNRQVELAPDFTDENLDLTGQLNATIIPIQLLWLSGNFLFQKPIRRLWWHQLRRTKKEVA